MPGVRQSSFGGGEWDPRLWARDDLKGYAFASRTQKNFYTDPSGANKTRPGTYYVNNTKNDQAVRLIPFNFADFGGQNYILEFGNLYVRFHTSAGTVESAPGVPLEVITPYVTADLAKLKYVQVGDVLTIVHGKYAPRELKRLGHTNWTLTEISFSGRAGPTRAPQIDTNAAFYPVIDATHPGKEWEWVATNVYPDGSESLASPIAAPAQTVDATSGLIACYTDRPVHMFLGVADTVGAVKNRYYKGRAGVFGYVGEVDVSVRITHTYSPGVAVAAPWFIDAGIEPDYTRNPPVPYSRFQIAPWQNGSRYEVGDRVYNTVGPDPTRVYECIQAGITAYTGSGPSGVLASISDGSPDWAPSTNYTQFVNWVVNRGSTFGCTTTGVSAASPATGPYGFSPISVQDGTAWWQWVGHGHGVVWKYVGELASFPNVYPSTVSVFEQRRVFGGTEERPATIFASRSDDYDNFLDSLVTQVTDAIEFDLAARRAEQIRSLIPLRHLITLTNSSEWVVGGAANGDPMSPFSIRARAHSEHGSSWLDPVVIGNTLIHVQPKGTVVRDMYFDVNIDSYTGNELSIFSKHFFRNHDIVSWCYAEDPDSVVWAVRDDGVLLSLTYKREMELFSWAQHETDGTFEQACSIPEGSEDSVYFVVLRGGQRFIERMSTREFAFVDDCHCVDAGVFTSGPTSVVSGLSHLEGRTVSALADGNLIEGLVVTGGQVTLPQSATKIHVGIPYICSWESLDVPQDHAKQKICTEVLLYVTGTRGIFVGETLEDMNGWSEWPQRTPALGSGSIPLSTGIARVTVSGKWGLGGRVAVQQRFPLPVTISAVQREVRVGGA